MSDIEKARGLYSQYKFAECAQFCRNSPDPSLRPILVQSLYKLQDYEAASVIMDTILDFNNETLVVNWMALKILTNNKQPIIDRYASDPSSCRSSYQQLLNVSCALFPRAQQAVFAQAAKETCIRGMKEDGCDDDEINHELFPIQIQLSEPCERYSESFHDIQTNDVIYFNSIIDDAKRDPCLANLILLQSIDDAVDNHSSVAEFKSSHKVIEGLHRRTIERSKGKVQLHTRPPATWKKLAKKQKKSKNAEYRHQGVTETAESKSKSTRSTASMKASTGSSSRRRR